MRRLCAPTSGRRLTLLLLAALLVGALGGAQPVAQAGPTAAQAPASDLLATDPAAPATPLISLPSSPIAAEPRALTRVAPGEKRGGLTPGAISFGAPATARLADLSSGCTNLSSNGAFEAGFDEQDTPIIYDWVEITSTLNLDDVEYVSYPYGVHMTDADELGAPDDGDGVDFFDEDWFGQDFTVPAETRSLLIDFSIKYPSGGDYGLDPADFGYMELYLVDANGDLVDAFPSTPILDGAIIWRLDRVFEEDPVDPTNQWWRLINFASDEGLPAEFNLLRGQRVAIVFSQLGDKLTPYEQPILDNVQVIACPQPSEPNIAIEGTVSLQGLPQDGLERISSANMALLYSPDGVDEELIRTVTPRTNGFYRFTGLPDLGPGGYYQVLYLKSGLEEDGAFPNDPTRLSYYAGPRITADEIPAAIPGDLSRDVVEVDFEILDTTLLGPSHLAEVSGDVTFSWSPSPIAGARYLVCFFDPATDDDYCTKPTTATSISASGDALKAVWPGFLYEQTLGWYVRVLGPSYNPAAPVFEDIGASAYSNYLTFFEQAAVAPAPPPVETTQPPGATGGESWTLMFYMAGDDEDLTNPPGFARSMQDMIPALLGLADANPDVNIVVQFDFFETDQSPVAESLRGTQYCYFKPGELNLATLCQQLGEKNMADEATLTGFVNRALASYPADHTALIILGHGSPVAGVAGDRTGVDDAMDPTELDLALKGANLNQPARKLDAIVFYNCLMGGYEVASVVAPYADYMVASPNIATLIDINTSIVELASANASNPRAFATGIVAAYAGAMQAYNEQFGNTVSIAMAAYDLSKLTTITPLVNALAQALIDNLSRPEVRDARNTVQEYDSSAPLLWGFNVSREDALVDLGNLATRLASSPNAAVSGAAQALLNALGAPGAPGAFVIANAASSGLADLREGGRHSFAPGAATGLSIYFPNGNTQGGQAAMTRFYLLYYRQLAFGRGTWDELVDATRTGLPSLPRGIRLNSLAGAPGTTLQNLVAAELFPAAPSMPGSSSLFMPMVVR